jgi:alpha-N-arabinofuranosidase
LIGYDALHSFGSPSYYAIQLFSRNHGDVLLKAALTGLPVSRIAPLDYSVTKDSAKGVIYLKVVNVTDTTQSVDIILNGTTSVASAGTITTLTGSPDETNSINDPVHLVPVTAKLTGLKSSFVHDFAPNSISVLAMRVK